MEALKKAGFRVVPVTGRPAGWCDHDRPLLAGRRRGGRERRLLDVARRTRRASSGRASCRTRPSVPTAAAGWRRCAPRCCATCRARASPRTSPIALADLAIDFCEDVAAAAPCRHRAHREDLRGARRPRQGELDPRQRLVRRLRQAHHQPADDGRAVRRRSRSQRATATSSPAIRPTTRRCSASSPMPWAWPTCATSPPTWTTCRAGSPTARSGAGFVELARALIAARR